jgi:hypothetical protein
MAIISSKRKGKVGSRLRALSKGQSALEVHSLSALSSRPKGSQLKAKGSEWRFHPDNISGMYQEGQDIIYLKILRYV